MVFKYEKGEPIVKWLYAGPFTQDVSHLYEDNYIVPAEPYEPYFCEAERAAEKASPGVREGDGLGLYGLTCPWSLLRCGEGEKKVTFAGFGVFARLMTTFVFHHISMEKKGTFRFKMVLSGSASVFVNGRSVFRHRQVGRVNNTFILSLELLEGVNSVLISMTNVHLHCINSFEWTPLDEACTVSLPLITADEVFRKHLEKSFDSFYIKEDSVGDEEDVAVCWDGCDPVKGFYRFTLYEETKAQENNKILEKDMEIFRCSKVLLINGRELKKAGKYIVTADYILEDGLAIKGGVLEFYKRKFMDVPANLDYSGRKEALLKGYASLFQNAGLSMVREGAFIELIRCKTEGAEKLNFAALEKTLDYIDARYDCADFALHGLLRLYCLFRNDPAIPISLMERIKKTLLHFKYWTDEPGKSLMFTRSENHEMLFYSAEYLAGLLFPSESFPNSGQNGLFHALKGRLNAERWIREKGRYGFMEWHSNCYYEEDMLALLNLYDFGEENSYLRLLAGNLLDMICLIIATHSFKGVLATTHGRSYENMVIHPEYEAMNPINWLLYGMPEKMAERFSIGAAALATGSYAPPPELEKIARSQEPLESLSCMGLFPHEGLGGVNCSTYRTRDYMVSGLVGSKAGQHGAQVHAGQLFLDGIPVFVTCFDNKSPTTRPSYWGGQYRIPKTIAKGSFLAYIYDIKESVGYTHCYFPQNAFDEVVKKNGWLFGRKNDAYGGVFSLKGYTETEGGSYRDRELLCLEKKNIWLLQAGSRSEFGSFEAFVQRVLEGFMKVDGEDLTYESPLNGRFFLSWPDSCTCDGVPLPEKAYPLIKNDFCFADYGTGIARLKLGGRERCLNFNI